MPESVLPSSLVYYFSHYHVTTFFFTNYNREQKNGHQVICYRLL